jgi:hypothetical protein
MARFVDRVEKRGEADRKLEDAAELAQIRAVRETIDARAFEMPILDVPLKEHILTILQEAGMESFGDLILQTKLDADKILSLNGIGPKAMDEITALVESYQFPALETVSEPTAEGAPAEVALDAAAAGHAAPEAVEAPADAAAAEEPAAGTEEAPAAAEEPETDEKSFEELFNLESLRRDEKIRDLAAEDEGGDLKQDKKGKGKKKKGYTVEYDPDKEESIVRYKHKKDDSWDEDW